MNTETGVTAQTGPSATSSEGPDAHSAPPTRGQMWRHLGPGIVVAATGVGAGDLVATLDGPGEIAARARYTAAVANGGLGRVTVAGTPKCRVTGGGPVRCGGK